MNRKLAIAILICSVVLLAFNVWYGITSEHFNYFNILSNLMLITVMLVTLFKNKSN